MRYFAIEFMSAPVVVASGFMEVDDNGEVVRLTDVNGKTLDPLPSSSYRTTNDKPAAAPAWASEVQSPKEKLKADYIAALKAGDISGDDAAAWSVEAGKP